MSKITAREKQPLEELGFPADPPPDDDLTPSALPLGLPPKEQPKSVFAGKCDEDQRIEFEYPKKGKTIKIVMGDPGVSILKQLKIIYGDKGNDLGVIAMAFLYIRQVDSDLIPPLTTPADMQYLIDRLGNRGVALVTDKWNKFFNFNSDDVPVVFLNLP